MSGINNNLKELQNKLFDSLADGGQLENVKNEAKGLLNGKGTLTDGQQVFLLNMITLINDILVNRKMENEKNPDMAPAFKAAADISGICSGVKNDKAIELINNLLKDLQKNKPEAYRKLQELLQKDALFQDLETYGTRALTHENSTRDALSNGLFEVCGEQVHMLSTNGDGNCLYRALSTCDAILDPGAPSLDAFKRNIRLFEQNHVEKRKLAAEHMQSRPDLYKKSEWQRHKKDRMWGEDTQIQALAAAENRPILVLKQNQGQTVGTIYAKGKDGENIKIDPKQSRVIVNLGNVHFNALHTTEKQRERLIGHFSHIVPVQ
ncbi:MAG: OTU domain-containing protein [Waddliaceae bacterium]